MACAWQIPLLAQPTSVGSDRFPFSTIEQINLAKADQVRDRAGVFVLNMTPGRTISLSRATS
jgi:hypothetical protein